MISARFERKAGKVFVRTVVGAVRLEGVMQSFTIRLYSVSFSGFFMLMTSVGGTSKNMVFCLVKLQKECRLQQMLEFSRSS